MSGHSKVIFAVSTVLSYNYGKSLISKPTCKKCLSAVRISFICKSFITTIEVRSVNEMSGLSLYFFLSEIASSKYLSFTLINLRSFPLIDFKIIST